MKMSLRNISMLLSVFMFISLFAGCGSSKNEGTESTTTAASEQEKTTAAPEPETETGKTITINWMPQNDAPVDEDSPIKKKLEEIFNIKLNYIYMDRSKEKELLNVRIASNEIPDVMRLTGDTFYNYIDQGVLAGVPEELIKETVPNLYNMTLQNSMDDRIWEYPKVNAKIYGIPFLNLNGNYGYIPIWRDDWLKNVGINKIPGTLAEAEDAFYKFVNSDPDKNGQKDTYALANTGMDVIFGAYGGIPLTGMGWTLKDGKIVSATVMPEMKEALTLLAKWYKDGLIDPEFITGENKGQYWANSVAFWNGKIGFSSPGMFYHVNLPLYEGHQGSANYQNFKKIQGEAATYSLGKPITGPDAKSGTAQWGTFSGGFIAMGKQVADDPDKMKKILQIHEKIVSDYDIYMLERFGIEGEHYEMAKVGDKEVPVRKEGIKIANLGLTTSGIGYLEINNFEFSKKSEASLYDYADKYAPVKETYNTALVWGLLPSNVQYADDLKKMIKEFYIRAITEENKVNEFDKFVEDVNKAGLTQLTNEADEWYQTYNKK